MPRISGFAQASTSVSVGRWGENDPGNARRARISEKAERTGGTGIPIHPSQRNPCKWIKLFWQAHRGGGVHVLRLFGLGASRPGNMGQGARENLGSLVCVGGSVGRVGTKGVPCCVSRAPAFCEDENAKLVLAENRPE